MLKHILMLTVLASAPVIGMDLEQSEQGRRHIINYEELNKQKVADEEITEIYHAEDTRLSKIMTGLWNARASLKRDVPEEAKDLKILNDLYAKYERYQQDNDDRWSEGFTKRIQEESQ